MVIFGREKCNRPGRRRGNNRGLDIRNCREGGAGKYPGAIITSATGSDLGFSNSLCGWVFRLWYFHADNDGGSFDGDGGGKRFNTICNDTCYYSTEQYTSQKIKVTFLASEIDHPAFCKHGNFWVNNLNFLH